MVLTLRGLGLGHSIERAVTVHDPDSILEAAESMVVAVEDRMLTTEDVATITGLSVGTVTRWLSNGRLRGFRLGSRWRVRRSDLEEFLRGYQP